MGAFQTLPAILCGRQKRRSILRCSFLRLAIVLLMLLCLSSTVLLAQTETNPAEPDQNPTPQNLVPDAKSNSPDAETPPTPTPTQQTKEPAAEVQGPRLLSPRAILENNKTPDDAAGPNITYLLDKNGQLIRVLNYSYEDFTRALDVMRGFRALAAPPYTLQSQKLTGNANSTTADLKIELKILLHTDKQVRIPLGLNQAVLRDWKYEGDGELFFNFEEGGDGYVSWIRGTPEKEHTLIMDIGFPVVKLGGETALRLGMPPSITSELTLDVNVPNAVGRIAENDTREIKTRNFATGTTQFFLNGMHGDFKLAWRPADSPAPTTPTLLTATSTLLVRIDGPSIQTDARLNVSSSGGDLESFSVRLPPGAKLIPGVHVGFELNSLPNQSAEEIAQRGEVLNIKLNQKTSDPVEIRLRTEQSRSGKAVLKGVNLAGFEVLNAARQWGYVAVEVIGDWQVQWGKLQDVRRIEKLPEFPALNDPIASFEFFGQPFVLTALISPRTTRVRVEPEYVLAVGPQQVSLDARLKYNIRGASEFALVVNVPGWEDVEVETVEGVDDKNVLREADQLTIPLMPPRTGPFELRFKARRTIAENTVKFLLPDPRATTHSTSTVVVLPDDNVELIPKPKEFIGLSPEHVLPRIDLPIRQQEPLVYRGEPGATEFSAEISVLPQTINTVAQTHLALESNNCQIEQKFVYQVEHEPVDYVNLLVPATFGELNSPEVSFDGQTLDQAALSIQPLMEEKESEGGARLRIRLPAPARFGRFELIVKYDVPLAKLDHEQPSVLKFPLFMPEEGTLGENTLVITSAPEIRLNSVANPWQIADSETDLSVRSTWKLSSSSEQDELELTVEAKPAASAGTTVIELAWLQSWLTRHERQDRVCYRFSTSEDHFELQLPEGVSTENVQATLDGFPIAAEIAENGKLRLTLPNAATARRRLLELQYRFGIREHRFGWLSLEAPKPLGGAWVESTYWQVILPREELLVFAPGNFIDENQWGWKGLFRGRQPFYEQAELEAMVGTSAGLAVPNETNRYLFRDLGAPERLQIATARLSMIVFLASLAALLIGLAFIYLPVIRRPWVLTLAAVAMLPVVAANPALAILIAQAAGVGLVLVLFALSLKLWFHVDAQTPRTSLPESDSPSEPRSSTRSYVATGSMQAPSSAATTIALHGSEAGE